MILVQKTNTDSWSRSTSFTSLLGAIVGSELGMRRLSPVKLRQLLGIVLVIAALKMLLTA